MNQPSHLTVSSTTPTQPTGTTIQKFPDPKKASVEDLLHHVNLLQRTDTTMSLDAVEDIVPFLVGTTLRMADELKNVNTRLTTTNSSLRESNRKIEELLQKSAPLKA